MITLSEKIAPVFYPVHQAIRDETYDEFWLHGGRGCVHPDTLLLTPQGKVKISDFKGGEIYCFDGKKSTITYACKPIKYKPEALYKITFDNGSSIITTKKHRFLTVSQWDCSSSLSIGCELPVIEPCLLQSNSDTCPLKSQQDVRYYFYTILSLIYHYWQDYRQYDVLPLHELDSYLDVLQILGDEEPHIYHTFEPLDDSELFYKYDLREKLLSLLSTLSVQIKEEGKNCEERESYIYDKFSEQLLDLFQRFQKSHENNGLDELIQELSKFFLYFYSEINQFENSQTISDILEQSVDDETYSNLLSCNLNLHYNKIKIISREFYSKGEFYDIFVPFYNNYITDGGIINHNSSKSSFISIQIILALIRDPEANAIAFRKVSRTIRDSIQGSLNWAIDELGESENFDSISSPAEITYKPTGQKIILRGLDEPRKLKSIKLRKGYFKILWFEEADEFNGDAEIRSVEQSILRGGEKFIEFLSYNPPRNPNHWINKLVKESGNKLTHHSTYLDVPKDWLGSKFFDKAERLKANNYETYCHEYLGKAIGNPKELVFAGKFEVSDFETPPLSQIYQSRFFFGADWGFANDPTVLIRCFIKDDCLWIDYEQYGVQVEIDHIGKVIFEKIPESKIWQIEADCSRPETISNLTRQGYRVRGAKKWAGSLEEGIEYIKSFQKVIIHSRCVNLAKEFENYSYLVDKETREILPKINDKKDRIYEKEGDKMGIKDDGIDAIRYALSTYIKKAPDIIAF